MSLQYYTILSSHQLTTYRNLMANATLLKLYLCQNPGSQWVNLFMFMKATFNPVNLHYALL